MSSGNLMRRNTLRSPARTCVPLGYLQVRLAYQGGDHHLLFIVFRTNDLAGRESRAPLTTFSPRSRTNRLRYGTPPLPRLALRASVLWSDFDALARMGAAATMHASSMCKCEALHTFLNWRKRQLRKVALQRCAPCAPLRQTTCLGLPAHPLAPERGESG